jgi:hypothetical protein
MLLYNFFLKLIWGLIITLLFAVHYNQWIAATVTNQPFPAHDFVVSSILPILLYIGIPIAHTYTLPYQGCVTYELDLMPFILSV